MLFRQSPYAGMQDTFVCAKFAQHLMVDGLNHCINYFMNYMEAKWLEKYITCN